MGEGGDRKRKRDEKEGSENLCERESGEMQKERKGW